MAELKIGLSAEMTIQVTKESTAAAVGSGSLEVFATPMMIAAMEEAACNAIFDVLGKGETLLRQFDAVAAELEFLGVPAEELAARLRKERKDDDQG